MSFFCTACCPHMGQRDISIQFNWTPTPTGESRRRARGRMYGMLFESIQFFIKQDYGLDTWAEVLDHAGIPNVIFIPHKTYPDEWMVNLARATCEVLEDMTHEDTMLYFGTCFVNFCCKFSYDKILRLAGRNYRDFLNEIDNVHETIRFSHPKMQSPSFIVQSEDRNGCVLIYRSMRTGFTFYVMGQLMQCARMFYDVSLEIKVLEEIVTDQGCHVTFRLIFDNIGYSPPGDRDLGMENLASYPEVKASTFFKLFPFCLVFNSKMKIIGCGGNLASLLGNKDLLGSNVMDMFSLRRPLVDFTWNNTMCLQKVIFEVEWRKDYGNKTPRKNSMSSLVSGLTSPFTACKDGKENCSCPKDSRTPDKCTCGASRHAENRGGSTKRLLLRGQMKYITDWDAMAFLCTPLLGNLGDMLKSGLYLHDLNMFDNSRDLVLAGTQTASDLEYSMEKQTAWSTQIEETLAKLDKARMQSENLINSMLTKSIADRLKRGDDALCTCESFPQVTILFSYLVRFSDICTEGSPMQVVQCIQNMTEVFDQIVDKYQLFKVETLGDGVYMVAGGVPDKCDDHARKVAGLALELVEHAKHVKNPINGASMQVRIGMHTGSVVAGIVGKRTPQYCLFGDTVNTAARMQTNSEPGRVHLTQPCHDCLRGTNYVSIYRGRIHVKGKGEMKTYWLAGQRGEESTRNLTRMFRAEHISRKQGSTEHPYDLHALHNSTSASNFITLSDMTSDDESEKELEITQEEEDDLNQTTIPSFKVSSSLPITINGSSNDNSSNSRARPPRPCCSSPRPGSSSPRPGSSSSRNRSNSRGLREDTKAYTSSSFNTKKVANSNSGSKDSSASATPTNDGAIKSITNPFISSTVKSSKTTNTSANNMSTNTTPVTNSNNSFSSRANTITGNASSNPRIVSTYDNVNTDSIITSNTASTVNNSNTNGAINAKNFPSSRTSSSASIGTSTSRSRERSVGRVSRDTCTAELKRTPSAPMSRGNGPSS